MAKDESTVDDLDLITEDDEDDLKDEQSEELSVPRWKDSPDMVFTSDFYDNISDFHTEYFVNKFRRRTNDECDLITLNDIKDVVLFTYWGNLNTLFIELFYTPAFDQFLRSLILYFQYFARLWYIVGERAKLKKTHIAHPNTKVHESSWRQQLSDLRFILARDYATILLGLNNTAKYHHFWNKHQTPEKDRTLFECMHKFSLRVLEVILNERGNQVMHEEFDRLFKTGTIKDTRRKKGLLENVDIDLEFPFYCPKLQFKSPLIKELYRPHRDPYLKNIGNNKLESYPNQYIQGIELGLLCSEEHFVEANIFIGILGKVRSQYDPLLTRQEDFMVENEDYNMYNVLHETVFGELTVDRRQAYNILPKRYIQKNYRIREDYYESTCINIKKERLRLKELWIMHADEKYRLKYQKNGERAILTQKEIDVRRSQRFLSADQDKFKKLEKDTKDNQIDTKRTMRLQEKVSITSLLIMSSSEERIQPTPISSRPDLSKMKNNIKQ